MEVGQGLRARSEQQTLQMNPTTVRSCGSLWRQPVSHQPRLCNDCGGQFAGIRVVNRLVGYLGGRLKCEIHDDIAKLRCGLYLLGLNLNSCLVDQPLKLRGGPIDRLGAQLLTFAPNLVDGSLSFMSRFGQNSSDLASCLLRLVAG